MKFVYLIKCVSFSCDIYSESEIDTSQAFESESDAETYILEKGLLDQCEYVNVIPVKVMPANSVVKWYTFIDFELMCLFGATFWLPRD